ncbi:MAG: hypothetical protein JWO62_2587 [Acidimicrobiaceae bacterium]|nr:hypothetical protein [Acidimicrobiaceae bacterium]
MSDRRPGQVDRSTTDGRAYLDLRVLAEADERTSAEYPANRTLLVRPTCSYQACYPLDTSG